MPRRISQQASAETITQQAQSHYANSHVQNTIKRDLADGSA